GGGGQGRRRTRAHRRRGLDDLADGGSGDHGHRGLLWFRGHASGGEQDGEKGDDPATRRHPPIVKRWSSSVPGTPVTTGQSAATGATPGGSAEVSRRRDAGCARRPPRSRRGTRPA